MIWVGRRIGKRWVNGGVDSNAWEWCELSTSVREYRVCRWPGRWVLGRSRGTVLSYHRQKPMSSCNRSYKTFRIRRVLRKPSSWVTIATNIMILNTFTVIILFNCYTNTWFRIINPHFIAERKFLILSYPSLPNLEMPEQGLELRSVLLWTSIFSSTNGASALT